MSNHITATQSKLIILCYKGGVFTFVPTFDYKRSYVENCIKERIEYFKDNYQYFEDSPCGITWNIDSLLNGLGLAQTMMYEDNNMTGRSFCICIPYYYDLGENETEEDVQKYYANYKYKKNEVINNG